MATADGAQVSCPNAAGIWRPGWLSCIHTCAPCERAACAHAGKAGAVRDHGRVAHVGELYGGAQRVGALGDLAAGVVLVLPRLAEQVGSNPLNYASQPYYPNPPPLPQGGPHLVYVDVWQREVTAVQAPDLVEKAVGVDSTGRLQTVWQVKVLANVGNSTCATEDEDVPGWLALTAPSAARLSTSTRVPNFEPDPCQVPPAAGFSFKAGQYASVILKDGAKRSYSMANDPAEAGVIEWHVRRMEGGRFSTHAYDKLKAGADVMALPTRAA